jgi:hypothetical protein
MRFAAAKAGTQSQREPGLSGLDECPKDFADDSGKIPGGVCIPKKQVRVPIYIRRSGMPGHHITKVGGEDRVLEIAGQNV